MTTTPDYQSLHVLSHVVVLNIAIRCELAIHILTIDIVYFACHGHVYLAGQRKEPGNTAHRTQSTDRSAPAHHFYTVCFSAAELFRLESLWRHTREQRRGWIPIKPH